MGAIQHMYNERTTIVDDTVDDNVGSEEVIAENRGPAGAIAAGVHEARVAPTEVVDTALWRISEQNRKTNAFSVIRTEQAKSEAADLEQRSDLEELPMAGVPVAVDHVITVAGETTLAGSAAVEPCSARADDEVVRRLRAAGAVVVGLTSVSELGLWATTDGAGHITRNPWNAKRTAGGASGGAAAAVAAGLVPVALGADGLGSVRVAAACCGVYGFKPGRHIVPTSDDWCGMAENGVLATTVGDAALMLAALAARPNLAEVEPPQRLRIALVVTPPWSLLRVDRRWDTAARTAAAVAAAAGHRVELTTLPYGNALPAVLLRWLIAALPAAARLTYPERLQARTRRHLALGGLVARLRLVRPAQIDRIEARLLEFFERYDVVITPTLTAAPPKARAWSARGWLTNVLTGMYFSAAFVPIWNLVGWPAATLPMGTHPRSNTPVAAQLAGPPGSEATLLRLSAQLEELRPWARTIH
ncbi:amidase family protein [Nocardia sp. NPDC048505]|uniref:amidase family protein n=1 Tax=unclassified Nocardia TaxID=2637762 RepID=UPI0033DD0BD6